MASTAPVDRCPVCDNPLRKPKADQFERVYFDCPQCGLFGLTFHAHQALPELLTSARKAAVLSYAIRKTPRSGVDTKLFDQEQCKKLVDADELPTPQEQGDNLIRWLGEHLPGPGSYMALPSPDVIEALSQSGLVFVVQQLLESDVLLGDLNRVMLAFKGWERFEELRRGAPSGRNAFMAMAFGEAVLDRVLADHFRPAVKQTGFNLKRVDDEPRAGLIDARMMAQIKAAWFVVADLTHGNKGAYWEAGYATGLDKPVIYTCERSVWEKEKTHFDTSHHLHIPWEVADMATVVQKLKATIRITIPEAKQQDDDAKD